MKWVDWASGQITGGRFDLVVTAARLQVGLDTLSYSPTPQEYAQGYVSAPRKLPGGQRAGPDAPRHAVARGYVPDCLARDPSDYTYCDGTRAAWKPPDPLVAAVAQINDPKVSTLDLADHLCRPTVCPAVIGGVPVHFDNSHLTATFSRTLIPYIEPALEQALRT